MEKKKIPSASKKILSKQIDLTLEKFLNNYLKIPLSNIEIQSIEPEWNLETKLTKLDIKQKNDSIDKLRKLVNNKVIDITNKYNFNHILFNNDQIFLGTPKNVLKTIDPIGLINENNRYFRFYSENIENILSSIYQIYINTDTLITYDEFLNKYNFRNFDEKYSDSLLSFSEKIVKIINNCNKIAENLNISIILVQDRIADNDIRMSNRHFVLCSNNSENPFSKKIALIYYLINQSKNTCNFEPIVSVNIEKNIIQYISSKEESEYFKNKIIEQDKKVDSIPNTEYFTTYPYPKSVTTISTYKPSVSDTEYEKKSLSSNYILFNSNDKDIDLPIIELIYDNANYNFLLGNKYFENDIEYHNIYEDNIENKLVGKIKFNDENILTVHWCKDYSIIDSIKTGGSQLNKDELNFLNLGKIKKK
tara:strand:- start:4193 stop:5452 length:1260 start_codon:yes stop_codon:yes gene_type:complete